ncbi:MAG: hypothetical protein OHK0046_13410 [Anaerolineae bacterium]
MDSSSVKRQSFEGLLTLILIATLGIVMVFFASQITHPQAVALATDADALNDVIEVCYRACTFTRGQ